MVKQEFTEREKEFQAQAIHEMSNDFAAALSKWSQIITNDERVQNMEGMLASCMFACMANVIADYAICCHQEDHESVRKYFDGVPHVFKANLFQIFNQYMESLGKIKKETIN